MKWTTVSYFLTTCLLPAVLSGRAAAGGPQVSSVLGPLPTPQELADAHEKLAPPPRGDLPVRMSIDAGTARRFERLYRYVTFKDNQLYGDYGSKTIPLGVTGIHVNEYANRHELFVAEVEPDGPAAGDVKRGDIILGANARLFGGIPDPRIPMGYALAEAQTEALGGVLTLQLVRDGKFLNVPVTLGVEGAYSPTWPFDCEKSRRLGDRLVAMILKRYPVGRGMTSRHAGGSYWHSLILLGAARDEALERARREIYGDREVGPDAWPRVRRIIESGRYPRPEKLTGSSWALGYELITLCEYYLLTGDSAVLPRIFQKKMILELGQTACGSWCHGMGMGGYGEVNATGGACFVGLALAAECGVKMHPVALKRSARFFRQFVGGGVPYGNHSPGPLGSSDNGKNAMPAVAFYILGEPDVAAGLARPTCYSYLCRENGHADGAFAFAWGPLGAYHAPKGEFHLFMNNLIWYYELGRTRDGGLRFLRGCHWSRPYGESGPMGLFLMMPRKQLRILGGPKSVFALRPPGALKPAAEMYKLKQWQALEKFLGEYLAKHGKDGEADYARRLLAAYRRLEDHAAATQKLIGQNIAKGDAWTACEQLAALRTLLGEERADMAKIRQYLESAAGLKALAESKKWDRPGAGRGVKPPVFDPGPAAPVAWVTPLASLADPSQQAACLLLEGDGARAPDRWCAPDFDDSSWRRIAKAPSGEAGGEDDDNKRYLVRRTFALDGGPYRFMQLETLCGGEVYVNGYRIATFMPDPWGTRRDRQDKDLRRVAVGALRPGKNVLAASLYGVPSIDLALRVGPGKPDLQALRTDMIGHWSFRNTQDVKPAGDARTVEGKLGRALGLPGSVTLTDFKQPADAKGRLGAMSVATWVHVPDGRRDELTLSCGLDPRHRRRKDAAGWALVVGRSANSIRLEAKAALSPRRAKAAPKQPVRLHGDFQHLVWVYDRSKNIARIYVNGAIREEQKIDKQGIATADAPLMIGSEQAAKLDELTVWRRALSEGDITALVRGGMGLSLEAR